MHQEAITALLLVVAIIHWLPVVGFLGVGRLESLYGVRIPEADLEILMRHRAMLFGILGGLFAYAAFTPTVQPLAFAAAAVSLLSFFYLAITVRGYGASIRKVVIADGVASACLLAAMVLFAVSHD